MLPGMELADRRELAERRLRELLADSGLPTPDEVEHCERSVRFLWHDRKVAVVVDLVDFEEIEFHGGYNPEGLAM